MYKEDNLLAPFHPPAPDFLRAPVCADSHRLFFVRSHKSKNAMITIGPRCVRQSLAPTRPVSTCPAVLICLPKSLFCVTLNSPQ